jgi:hypothetical protein
VANKWGKANAVNLLLDSGAKIDVKTRVSIAFLMRLFNFNGKNIIKKIILKLKGWTNTPSLCGTFRSRSNS